jgi:hypothetical protein
MSRPECLASLGVCGCSDTDGDSECGGSMSGVVCNGPAGICIPGCSTAANRNRCPAGQMCSDMTGRIGTCIAAQGCQSNADCMPPRPICDTAVMPRVCVQCLMDAQCLPPLICDATATKICVECTVGRTQNCTAQNTGARCLANNTCGCTTDSDCGAANSGRVCNGVLGRCTFGCRGVGGNGCPAPLVCTSTTNTIGTCAMVPDGGFPEPRPEAGADVPRDMVADLPRDAADAPGDVPVLPDALRPPDGASPDLPRPEAGAEVRDAVATDAAGDAETDAVARRDSAIGVKTGYVGGSGCDCTLGGRGDGAGTGSGAGAGSGGAFLMVAALAFLRRRRRKRAR